MGLFQRFAVSGATALLALAAGCQTAPKRVARAAPPATENASALIATANAALQRGDCRTAAESYARAAAQGTSASLARRATRVAITCHDLPAAWRAVGRWRELVPQDNDATLLYGTVALSLYQIPKARAALTTLIRRVGSGRQRDELSLIALMIQDPDVGAGPTLAALGGTVNVQSPGFMLTAFGALALRAYNFELAAKHASEALAHDPRSGPALRLLARAEALEGRAGEAIATAKRAMKIDPQGSEFELADVLTALNRLDAAKRELRKLRGDGVSATAVDRRLAVLDFQSGEMGQAQRRFTALVKQGNGGESAYLYLGDIAARAGDDYTALTEYRQLDDTSLALTGITRAAGILIGEGEPSQALGIFDSYESEHPEDAVQVALAKASVFAGHGHAKEALSFVAAALERFPGQPRLEYERATVLEQAGEVHQSVAAFEQLLRERPGDPQVLNALGYTLADHRLQLPRAESLIRRALAVSPDDPAMLDSLGWVRLRRGDPRSALPLLARAYRLSGDPQIAAHWGEALWVSGRRDEARKVLAKALARDPDSRALKETVHRLEPPVRS